MKLWIRRWSWATREWDGPPRIEFASERHQLGRDMAIYHIKTRGGAHARVNNRFVVAWANASPERLKTRRRYQYVRIDLTYDEARRLESAIASALNTRYVRKDAYRGRLLTRHEAHTHEYPAGPGRRRP